MIEVLKALQCISKPQVLTCSHLCVLEATIMTIKSEEPTDLGVQVSVKVTLEAVRTVGSFPCAALKPPIYIPNLLNSLRNSGFIFPLLVVASQVSTSSLCGCC